MRAKLSIYRYNPETKEQPRYDTYEIDTEPAETVLSSLIKVNEELDPGISFRYACGKVKCGECSLKVNGTPCLACNRKIEPEMKIEPLSNLPIIKDLVIDRNKAIDMIVKIAPSLLESKIRSDLTMESYIIDTYVKLTSCFECLICQSVCPILNKDKSDGFIGPLGLLWLAQASLTDPEVLAKFGDVIRMCKNCGICWEACPSEVEFLEGAITGLIEK